MLVRIWGASSSFFVVSGATAVNMHMHLMRMLSRNLGSIRIQAHSLFHSRLTGTVTAKTHPQAQNKANRKLESLALKRTWHV